jgi:membrane protein implicated in regulation of membrane protease activity
MPAWVLWLVLAVALAIGEVLTLSLFLGPVALGAVAAGALALIGLNAVLQMLAFVVVSALSIGLLRPIARRHLWTPPALRTGTAALVGARATVLERVDDLGGRVQLGGEVWSARAFFEGHVFERGARVEVARIEGATALVHE